MEEQERPSKTRLKKEMHQLQALGERLVELSPEHLALIPLEEDLRDAVLEARRMTRREARRRQLQYIGRLMREVDPVPIRERIDLLDGRSREHAALIQRLERWRERLLEDEAALAAFAREHAVRDWRALRILVREARRERAEGRPPRRYRELFRALKDILAAARI